MRLIIDDNLCVGCGLCEEVLPEVFEVGKFVAHIIVPKVSDTLIDSAISVVEDCPAEAISAVD